MTLRRNSHRSWSIIQVYRTPSRMAQQQSQYRRHIYLGRQASRTRRRSPRLNKHCQTKSRKVRTSTRPALSIIIKAAIWPYWLVWLLPSCGFENQLQLARVRPPIFPHIHDLWKTQWRYMFFCHWAGCLHLAFWSEIPLMIPNMHYELDLECLGTFMYRILHCTLIWYLSID